MVLKQPTGTSLQISAAKLMMKLVNDQVQEKIGLLKGSVKAFINFLPPTKLKKLHDEVPLTSISKDDVVFVKVNNKKYYVHPYTLRLLLNNNTIACSSSKEELDAEYFSYVCSDSYSFSEWLIRYLRNNISNPLDQLYLATLHEPTKTRLLAYDKYKEFADSFLKIKNSELLNKAFKDFVESKKSE